MTEPFLWIDEVLRSHGLSPPDWTKALPDSQTDDAVRSKIGNWRFFAREDGAKAAYKQLNERYPERSVLAFARDRGSDDIACFVLSDPASNAPIVVIHDYAPPQIAVRGRYDSFEDWVAAVSSREDERRE